MRAKLVLPALGAALLLTGCAGATSGQTQDAAGSDDAAPASITKPAVAGSWIYQGSAFAGTGESDFKGEGVPATAASLWQPRAMVRAADGSVYLADTWNNRIRKIDSKGIITTTAGDGSACPLVSPPSTCGDGDLATKAQLNRPSGLIIKKQVLIVADTGSHRVRQIDLATGIISNLAGNGAEGYSGDGGPATQAQLAGPLDIAVGTAGNLLIADTDNNRIRSVDANGTITTIAGTGSQCLPSQSCGVGGPASAALLATPSGIEVDQVDGKPRILIADTNSHTIRSIDSNGTFNTLIGTGNSGKSDDGSAGTQTTLSHPRRVQTDADGHVVVSDTGNQRLMFSAGDGSEVWQVSSHGIAVNEPWDSITTPTGFLVADAGNNQVLTLGSPTGPTLGWGACGPDSYAHIGPTGILSATLMLLPGTTSLDTTGWGAAGGDQSGTPGGAGGYARTLAPARTDRYAVIIGCQGAAGYGKSGRGEDGAQGSAGGGGATALVSLAGYSAGTAKDQVVLVAGGGGGASGSTCWWETSYPVGPGTPCFPGSGPAPGGAGGNRTGAAGTQAPLLVEEHSMGPKGATGGSGTGLGGKPNGLGAPVPVEPWTSGGDGLGGPGGDGSSGNTGGWGPQWCRATADCPADQTPPGRGGNGIKQSLNGGGGGGGAGGGGGGWTPESSEAEGAGGGGGGGSWATCADTTSYPDSATPAPPIATRNGYLQVTPGSAAAGQQCKTMPLEVPALSGDDHLGNQA